MQRRAVPLQGNGWRPTQINRFIRSFGSSVAVARVETDMGDGYLKALGNPEGPHALACDLVGSMLADWLGLSTFDFSLIEVAADDEIPFVKGGKARAGPAFISRAEVGFSWGGAEKELKYIVNPLEINGLIVMDTWTLNYDRYSPDGSRVNRDNVFLIQQTGRKSGLRIVAMDFTHAFRQGQDINRRIGFIERIQDQRIYGLFPEFRDFLNRDEVRRLAGVLGGFVRATAEEIVRTIPTAWEVDVRGQSAWATLITERAHFLAQHLESILWPQLELEGGTA
jgi:hypothetical protein